jgi:hypothetical protein
VLGHGREDCSGSGAAKSSRSDWRGGLWPPYGVGGGGESIRICDTGFGDERYGGGGAGPGWSWPGLVWFCWCYPAPSGRGDWVVWWGFGCFLVAELLFRVEQ